MDHHRRTLGRKNISQRVLGVCGGLGEAKQGTYCVSEPFRLAMLYCGCRVDHEVTPSNSAPLLNPLVIARRRGSLEKEGEAILWA